MWPRWCVCIWVGTYWVNDWMGGWTWTCSQTCHTPCEESLVFRATFLAVKPFWSGMWDPISKCRERTQATGYHEKIQSPSKPYLASFPGEPENEAKQYLYVNTSPNTSLLWQGMPLKTPEVLSLGDVRIWTKDLRWKGIHEWAIRRTVNKWAGELVHYIKPSDHEPRMDT